MLRHRATTSALLKRSSTLTATRVFFLRYRLNFYLTGKVRLVEGWCVPSFRQEMEYWGIREAHLAPCCSSKPLQVLVSAEDERRRGSSWAAPKLPADVFRGSWGADVRRNVWIRLEKPATTASARAVAGVSLAVVIGSVVSMRVHSYIVVILTKMTFVTCRDQTLLYRKSNVVLGFCQLSGG